MTPTVNVCLVNFPCRGEEMVVPNEDNSYTVIINSRLSKEKQLAAWERNHQFYEDTGNDCEKYDVQQIEAEAHN